MRLRDNQTFLSLYYDPHAVEIATGVAETAESAEQWEGETRHLGQVATPEPIARLMAKWVMSAKPRTVLDPAAGLGGLLAACREIDGLSALAGVERDTETLRRAIGTAPRGAKLILADYLKSDAGLFEAIIANPPYVKAHRLDYTERDWRYFEESLGTPLDRLTNLYALFLLKIWRDLAPRGRAAVILPSEFLNANFGEEIKEQLVRVIRPTGLLVFASNVRIFDDALTTSAIVFMEKSRKADAPCIVARVESVEKADGFVDSLLSERHLSCSNGYLEISTLNPRLKWLNLLFNGKPQDDPMLLPNRVGDYFDCRRGIATGANDYFCLRRIDLDSHRLTDEHVEPCITKSVDVNGLVFTHAKLDALAANNRRCFLLNPLHRGPDLMRYLKIGEHRGIPQRHLPSHRPTWYLPENRAVADIWAGVFSRQSVKFVLNRSGAKNLTCFHGLYAKSGYESLPPLMTLFLNSSAGRTAFFQVNRFYGGGLNKLEPKDVQDMPCPTMSKLSCDDAENLTCKLAELEELPMGERTKCLDKLLAHYFDTSFPPAKSSSSRPRRVQTRRPARQQIRRAVPVP
jgi:adenine-specific DNA-methyltransferase